MAAPALKLKKYTDKSWQRQITLFANEAPDTAIVDHKVYQQALDWASANVAPGQLVEFRLTADFEGISQTLWVVYWG